MDEKQSVDVDALLRRVRSQAAAGVGAGAAVSELRSPSVRPNAELASSQAKDEGSEGTTLLSLLSLQDEEFLHNAYRRILLRDPDPSGREYFLSALRGGSLSKLDVLVSLRFSEEGRRASVHIPGLNRAYWTRRIVKIPVIGYLLQVGYGIIRLPTLVNNFAKQEAHVAFRFTASRRAEQDALDRIATMIRHSRSEVDLLLETKAERQEVTDLRAETSRKASQDMALELQHHVARLEFGKGNRNEFAAIEARCDSQVAAKADRQEMAAMAVQMAGKANRAEVSAVAARVALDRDDLSAQLGAKADRQEMAAVAAQMAGKADREEVSAVAARIAAHREEISAQLGAKADCAVVTGLAERVNLKADRQEVGALAGELATKAAEPRLTEVAESSERGLADLSQRIQRMGAVKADQEKLAAVESRVAECEGQRVDPHRVAGLDEGLQAIQHQMAVCRQDLQDQHRRLAVILEQARRRMPEPFKAEQLEELVREERHFLDSLYVAFEDRFRGSRETIREGARVYLRWIQEALKRAGKGPVLDVACGRGEWLELLKEQGIPAKGVDLNRAAVEQCRELGLEVVEEDAIEHVRKQHKNVFSAVTCFHYVEHVDYRSLVALLDESLRILRPGVVAIFETPNARNLLVTGGDFFRDPTHQHPVFPDTLEAIAELRGFAESTAYCFNDGRTELVPLSQYRFDKLEDYISISRDMVWIGVKPL